MEKVNDFDDERYFLRSEAENFFRNLILQSVRRHSESENLFHSDSKNVSKDRVDYKRAISFYHKRIYNFLSNEKFATNELVFHFNRFKKYLPVDFFENDTSNPIDFNDIVELEKEKLSEFFIGKTLEKFIVPD
jgi:hypothetical protein